MSQHTTANTTAYSAIKLAILAGEVMLVSGAETYRVEDTMLRMLVKCGLSSTESLCTSTAIFVGATDEVGAPLSMVRRIKNRSNNVDKVARVNEVSRKFVEGKLSIEEAIEALENIKVARPYSPIVRLVGSAVASAAFAVLFGGTWMDSIAAFIASFLMQIPVTFLDRWSVSGVLLNITGGAFGAFAALLMINLGVGHNIDFVVIGAIMPLVPGVSLTNAIRDILEGDMLSGSARILEALLVAIGIAVGVGVVFTSWVAVFGSLYGGAL